MNTMRIVTEVRRRLVQRADATYYGTHRLPGGRYALSCSAPVSGAPGLTAAVNAALEIDGRTLRVVIGDAGLGSPWNARHGLQPGEVTDV